MTVEFRGLRFVPSVRFARTQAFVNRTQELKIAVGRSTLWEGPPCHRPPNCKRSLIGRDAAASVGLAYASPDEAGILRVRSGKGFSYRALGAERVRDSDTLRRIRKLAIPPAWTSVWICPDPKRSYSGGPDRMKRAAANIAITPDFGKFATV